MPALHYLIGDATEPVIRPAIIAHVCNDVNAFGAGFVVALSKKFPEAKKVYHEWFKTGSPQLGDVQFVQVSPDILIANMIAQHDIKWKNRIPPIRYKALELCLEKVYEKASLSFSTLHMPRIGCTLSGGAWDIVSGIINNKASVETYIYTLKAEKDRCLTVYENVS